MRDVDRLSHAAIERKRARNRLWREKNREECVERAKAWCKANPERRREIQKAYRERNKERISRLAREKAKAKRDEQTELLAGRPAPDRCEVCGGEESSRKQRMHYDHCHKTGKFRGWLCARCNMTLGQVEDNPELLLKLAEYLRTHHAN